MSSILGATQGQQQFTPPTFGSGTFLDVSQVAVAQQTTQEADASVSINANLNNVTAATGTGQLALAFAQAVQSATQVDPSTGHREIIAGANAQLTSTLNTLLEQNGFTSQQASAATANLATELAQGGQITLSTSYDQATQASASVTSNYASGASSWTSAVEATDRSGSLTIGLNLNTGEVNVAATSQSYATYVSQGEIAGSGSLAAPVGQLLLLPSSGAASGAGAVNATAQAVGSLLQSSLGQASNGVPDFSDLAADPFGGFGTASANSPLSESEVDTYSAAEVETLSLTNYSQADGAQAAQDAAANAPSVGSSSPSGTQTTSTDNAAAIAASYASAAAASSASTPSINSAEDTLHQLVASLNNTKLLAQQETASLLQSLSKLAAAANAAANSNQSDARNLANLGGAATPASSTTAGGQSSDYFSLQISFTQTLSIQQLDLNGYGSTLYQRPDGNLGQVSTQPTHVTA